MPIASRMWKEKANVPNSYLGDSCLPVAIGFELRRSEVWKRIRLAERVTTRASISTCLAISTPSQALEVPVPEGSYRHPDYTLDGLFDKSRIPNSAMMSPLALKIFKFGFRSRCARALP